MGHIERRSAPEVRKNKSQQEKERSYEVAHPVTPAHQLRDHTGQKRRYWLVLKEIIRAAPRFFLHELAWY
jgi:hypothetical protein